MMKLACASVLVALAAAGSVLAGGTQTTPTVFNGRLYYTTFNGPDTQRVHAVDYSYNSATHALSYTNNHTIVTDKGIGADGLLFAPDGKTLLIGGQSTNKIFHVDPSTGHVLQGLAAGQGVDHLALSPDGTKVYGGGEEANSPGVTVVPTSPFANGASHKVTGSTSDVVGIAFDRNGNAFYTSSPAGGTGSFGTINLAGSTFTTKATLTRVVSAHGVLFDPFTNDLILQGGDEVGQIDPTNPTVLLHHRSFSGYGAGFDQGAADGFGHLFVANNDGNLLFIDYSATGNVADPSDFTNKHFLAANLDDVAPLSGIGSRIVPEPGGLTLAALCAACVAARSWRRRPPAAIA